MDTIPIKTLPSASKDIDPVTIRRLYHEEGMTIKAVAELCGISTPTVRRYLGPVGRRKYPVAVQPPKQVLKIAENPTPVLVHPAQLMRSKTELKGKAAIFEIDHVSGTLYVRGSTFEMLLTREDVEQFIWELVEAYESIPKLKDDSGGDTTKESDANGDDALERSPTVTR